MDDRKKRKVDRVSDMLNIDKNTVEAYLEAYNYDEDKTIKELQKIILNEIPKYIII